MNTQTLIFSLVSVISDQCTKTDLLTIAVKRTTAADFVDISNDILTFNGHSDIGEYG